MASQLLEIFPALLVEYRDLHLRQQHQHLDLEVMGIMVFLPMGLTISRLIYWQKKMRLKMTLSMVSTICRHIICFLEPSQIFYQSLTLTHQLAACRNMLELS
jgi:Na+/proline symporter